MAATRLHFSSNGVEHLLRRSGATSSRGARNERTVPALLATCRLIPRHHRHEAVNLDFSHVQQREDHWAIIYLKVKWNIGTGTRL